MDQKVALPIATATPSAKLAPEEPAAAPEANPKPVAPERDDWRPRQPVIPEPHPYPWVRQP